MKSNTGVEAFRRVDHDLLVILLLIVAHDEKYYKSRSLKYAGFKLSERIILWQVKFNSIWISFAKDLTPILKSQISYLYFIQLQNGHSSQLEKDIDVLRSIIEPIYGLN